VPLKNYCKGLLLPGERKSIEPMAARLDRDNVQPTKRCDRSSEYTNTPASEALAAAMVEAAAVPSGAYP
jgi:SRSO17 transposase